MCLDAEGAVVHDISFNGNILKGALTAVATALILTMPEVAVPAKAVATGCVAFMTVNSSDAKNLDDTKVPEIQETEIDDNIKLRIGTEAFKLLMANVTGDEFEQRLRDQLLKDSTDNIENLVNDFSNNDSKFDELIKDATKQCFFNILKNFDQSDLNSSFNNMNIGGIPSDHRKKDSTNLRIPSDLHHVAGISDMYFNEPEPDARLNALTKNCVGIPSGGGSADSKLNVNLVSTGLFGRKVASETKRFGSLVSWVDTDLSNTFSGGSGVSSGKGDSSKGDSSKGEPQLSSNWNGSLSASSQNI